MATTTKRLIGRDKAMNTSKIFRAGHPHQPRSHRHAHCEPCTLLLSNTLTAYGALKTPKCKFSSLCPGPRNFLLLKPSLGHPGATPKIWTSPSYRQTTNKLVIISELQLHEWPIEVTTTTMSARVRQLEVAGRCWWRAQSWAGADRGTATVDGRLGVRWWWERPEMFRLGLETGPRRRQSWVVVLAVEQTWWRQELWRLMMKWW